MNICLISQEYPTETDFGGISTYMGYLSKGLINAGNKVYVVCRSYRANSVSMEDGVEVHRIMEPNENIYRLKVAELVKNLIEQKSIDIIESPEWQADLIEYYKLYKEDLKIPVVIKLHTPYFVWKKYNYLQAPNLIAEIEEWEKKVVCEADGVFSCSEDLKQVVTKEYDLDSNTVITIPNMIDVPDNRMEYYDCYDEGSIYFFGSLEQRKGVLVLAEAFNYVKEKIPNAKLFFVGRDTCRNDKKISTISYIKSVIRDDDSVSFIKHVKNDLVCKYMMKANVLVFPSLYENFPYVVLEGMLCGKSIVGSSSGGMKEMMEDYKEGVLYPPPDAKDLANKIESILLDKELCKDLGKNAFLKVEEFATERVVERQIKFYKEIINNGR